ncbi:restriction endonuclease [Candidatus Moduliflexus flocculans]|uniref:Restriction endonuclease n=1 Tax=Candidatus Moduliflexus flocculans TaxID=1499966 RepID=A0A0S6VW32_9BACT|nr:restriction endonuclease [Candidatus Moduliflexus flocculans]
MKAFLIDYFRYANCAVEEDGNALAVTLTPELATHIGKPRLRLVFNPAHLTADAELVTPGSYLINRLYETLKNRGAKMAMTLPLRHVAAPVSDFDIRVSSALTSRIQEKETHETEALLTFRVTFHSNEKREELITIGVDMRGKIRRHAAFPYPIEALNLSESSRFPFTKTEAKAIYERCLQLAQEYAGDEARRNQQELARHFHRDALRLQGFYRQLIEEIPDLAINREYQTQQYQAEYERKAADELQKCQVQVFIEPVAFCAVNTPFQRYRFVVKNRAAFSAEFDAHLNLFSGQAVYPECPSCQNEMHAVGLCERGEHAVCETCLETCHVCGQQVCRACGISECAECGEFVCHDCAETCHLCGKTHCPTHLLGCRLCRKHFCRACSATCGECGKIVGNIHVIECDISHQPVCFDCLVTCPCCDKHVGRSHAKTCAFCGRQMCEECAFSCAECGQTFCVHHVRECDISGKMTCPRHSAVCASCGRHVSAKYLKKCDVCRTTVCVKCATRCSGCGHYFCEQHRDEMTVCAECGKRYCSLCGSGQDICAECLKRGQG